MKGKYIISLANGEKIELVFTTWVFKEFCATKGFSVDELYTYIGGNLLKTEDMITLMLKAAEYVALNNKQEFKYTDFDACKWMDELGGITSEKLKDLGYVMISGLMQKEVEEVKTLVEIANEKAASNGNAEKKSGERHGGRYIRNQPKQG